MLENVIGKVGGFVTKNKTTLLIGAGIGLSCGAVVSTIFATKTALEKIEEAKLDKQEPLTKKEVVKAVYKEYIPPALLLGSSILFIVTATKGQLNKNAVLASAYTAADKAYKDYKHHVDTVLGPKKATELNEKVKDTTVKEGLTKDTNILITGRGNLACYDTLSDRYFESDIETIRCAVNEINRLLMVEEYVLLNDFYNLIGLPDIKLGTICGWKVNIEHLDVKYTSHLSEEGVPCLVIDYETIPLL